MIYSFLKTLACNAWGSLTHISSGYISRFFAGILFFALMQMSVHAATFGDFTYTDEGSSITITGYTGSDTDVVFPDSIVGKTVTKVNNFYFENGNVVESLYIPSTVTKIGSSIVHFNNCPHFLNFYVDSANPNYKSVDGVLFSRDGRFLYSFPAARSGSYSMPDGVIDVLPWSFSGSNIIEVVFSNTVETIHESAFSQSEFLTSVVLNDGIQYIRDFAFVLCPLKEITFPSSNIWIYTGAFDNLRDVFCEKNAPILTGFNQLGSNSELKVFYHEGATGFDGSDWDYYNTSVYFDFKWVEGKITDSDNVGIGKVTINFSGGLDSVTSGSSGYFATRVPESWSGMVVPSKSDWVFDASYQIIAPGTEDVSGVDFTGQSLAWSIPQTWSEKYNPDPKTLKAVEHAGGSFVAVGNSGSISTSTNGRYWTSLTSGISENLNAVASNSPGTAWVAVGDDGWVIRSSNLSSWTASQIVAGESLNALVFDSNRWVATTDAGKIFYSADNGVSWTQSSTGNGSLVGVVYQRGFFYAANADGRVLRSANGSSWSIVNASGAGSSVAPAVTSIVTIDDFIALFHYSNAITELSLDGTTWFNWDYGVSASAIYDSVRVGGTNGIDLLSGSAGWVVSIPDDTLWREQVVPTLNDLHGIASDGTNIVAVGYGGTLVFGADGHQLSGNISYYGTDASRVMVELWNQTQTILLDRTVSDNFGNYSFKGLGSATYVVKITSSAETGNQNYLKSVAVNSSHIVHNIVFRGLEMSGRIVNGSGTGIADVTVNFSDTTVTALTDANGDYAIELPLVWKGMIVPAKSGYSFENSYLIVDDSTTVFDAFDFVGSSLETPIPNRWSETQSPVSSNLNGIVYAANIYAVVGDGGVIMTTTNGHVWHQKSSALSVSYNAIAANNNGTLWVIAADDGWMLRSSDLNTWVRVHVSSSDDYNEVVFGAGLFVATTDSGRIIRSADGATWTRSAAGLGSLVGVVFQNNTFFAANSAGDVYRSADAISWTKVNDSQVSTAVASAVTSIVKIDDFIALFHYNNPVSELSLDGEKWFDWDYNVSASAIYDTTRFGGEAGIDVMSGSTGWVITIPDDTLWDDMDVPSVKDLFGIATDGHGIVAVGNDGKVVLGETGSFVWGKVSYYDTDGVEGKRVLIYPNGSPGVNRFTVTDSEGFYRFYNLEEGDYQLLIQHEENGYYLGGPIPTLTSSGLRFDKVISYALNITFPDLNSVSEVFDLTPSFKWEHLANSTYRYQLNRKSDWAFIQSGSGFTSTEIDIATELTPGVEYVLNLTARSGGVISGAVELVFTVSANAGNLVDLIAPAENARVGTIDPSFSWDSYTGASRYLLQVWDKITGVRLLNEDVGSSTSFQSSLSLSMDANYEWRVTAFDGSTAMAQSLLTVFNANSLTNRADFNNDGFSDLLLQDQASFAVTGQGMNGAGGTIGTAQALISGSEEVQFLSLLNMDQTGQNDLLIRNLDGSNTFEVRFRDSNGIVTGTKTFDPGAPEWRIVGSYDQNGDGNTDLLWQNIDSGKLIIWYLNARYVRYDFAQIVGSMTDFRVVAVGDMDDDGFMDILWQRYTDSKVSTVVAWYLDEGLQLKPGGGSATLANISGGWFCAGLADYNSDGVLDLVWQNTDSFQILAWLMNTSGAKTGSMTLDSGTSGLYYANWRWVLGAAAPIDPMVPWDFDGDDNPDLVVQNDSTGVVEEWYMDDSWGITSTSLTVENTAAFGNLVAVSDMNADGINDYVWVYEFGSRQSVVIREMNVDRTSDKTVYLSSVSLPYVFRAVGDMNSDGYADILWQDTNTGKLIVWYMDGSGHRTSFASLTGRIPIYQVQAVADMDRDGNDDIIWQGRNGANHRIIIWYMDGSGRRSSWVNYVAVNYLWSLNHAADYNGDSYLDLVWYNETQGISIGWLLNASQMKTSNTTIKTGMGVWKYPHW